jgi:hypothetical protein
MAINIAEVVKQGHPLGRAKYTFFLDSEDDLVELKKQYPPKGTAVNTSIALIWRTGAAYALLDDGWVVGG